MLTGELFLGFGLGVIVNGNFARRTVVVVVAFGSVGKAEAFGAFLFLKRSGESQCNGAPLFSVAY